MQILANNYKTIGNRRPEQNSIKSIRPSISLSHKDSFYKSGVKSLTFSGGGDSLEELTESFDDALYGRDIEKACTMIRQRQIPVNEPIGYAPSGMPNKTLFQEFIHGSNHIFHDLNILKEMVDAGADLGKVDRNGYAPIHQIAMSWGAEAINLLVDAGADINQSDNDGLTALHHAADFGKPNTVRALISKGANIEATSGSGWTPLFSAILQGNITCVEAVLNAGALTNIVNKNGQTPLELAFQQANLHENIRSYNLPVITDLLLQHGAVFPNEQARFDYLSLLKKPHYNTAFKELDYPAIKRFVQNHLPHPDEPFPLNQELPNTEDYKKYRKAALEVFRERTIKQGPGHPFYHLFRHK